MSIKWLTTWVASLGPSGIAQWHLSYSGGSFVCAIEWYEPASDGKPIYRILNGRGNAPDDATREALTKAGFPPA